MKYLKTFESYGNSDLALEIAENILPDLKKIKSEKGIFTVGMLDNYMEERGGDMKLTDEVMSYLVNMGFDFDSDDDDDDFGFESPFCKPCEGTGCEECDGSGMKRNPVVNNDPRGDFEGYPGMEYSLN